jgi:biotin operon repressor
VEQTRTSGKISIQVPEDVKYQPVGDDGEVPERFSAVFELTASQEAQGVAELTLDMTWDADEQEFGVTTLTARAAEGGKIANLEGIRTAFLPAFRQASRGVVKVRLDAVDDKEASTIERAATLYRLAKAAGESPTKAVAEKLGISRDAAAQQVRRARQEGLLPKVKIVRGERSPGAQAIWEEHQQQKASD